MSSSIPGSGLRDLYAAESARIQKEFEATGNGRAVTESRAALIDRIVSQLFREVVVAENPEFRKLSVVALGGYGRRALFPYSDIDLLFLCEDSATETRFKDSARILCQELWDMRMRVSPTTRTLGECSKFRADNPEFNISLLDCRGVAGDAALFAQLRDRVLPQLVSRHREDLRWNLAELTRERHAKHGATIFHLEPNLKNSPGGLRDYHVSCWLHQIAALAGDAIPDEISGAAPAKLRADNERAFDFLAAARCLVHYWQGRDDNALTYELQAHAALLGMGVERGREMPPSEWMRCYFRHARSVFALATQLIDEAAPERPSLAERVGEWKSRISNLNFVITAGRLALRGGADVKDPDRLLELFEWVARDGVKLSRETERDVEAALPMLESFGGRVPNLWAHLRQILVAPYASDALRAMHALGVLVRLFPEFAVIDSLVIRDFYHHYTVDAHSFITIENLQVLREPKTEWEQKFAELLLELETPELLFLSLLFHDVGKGMANDDHIEGSLQAVEEVFPRLGLTPEESETVRYLIANHLEMSANLLRRDIFDPQTIRTFAEKVGTPERLKILCLFTYADIRAVNPEALTPWKAESLWQLYVSTENYLNRSLDEERVRGGEDDRQWVERILPLVSEGANVQELREFLQGLPRRYLLAHAPKEVALHFRMSQQLDETPVELHLESLGHIYALTILTADRPYLFAGISGTLAAWGMNIWKAEAFANASGTIVDTFHFSDPHRTLELNPSESERFKSSVVEVLSSAASLETLLRTKKTFRLPQMPKITVSTQIRFDDFCSSHSTLMEIITQDHPGLLYQITSALAQYGCNLEVALIDTEGQRAIDVFYLTLDGAKLGASHQRKLRDALLAQL
ncbi:MAG: [protein-PII] uridylyltransferase [Candidatus Acidiferrales bacterium]